MACEEGRDVDTRDGVIGFVHDAQIIGRKRRCDATTGVRMGNIVGTHEVIINAGTQVLTLKHEALDRAMFAEGAIIAAEFLLRQKPGLYDMQDLAAAL